MASLPLIKGGHTTNKGAEECASDSHSECDLLVGSEHEPPCDLVNITTPQSNSSQVTSLSNRSVHFSCIFCMEQVSDLFGPSFYASL